jgi:ABC-2 type transport system ATP-binding protein
MVNVRSLVKSLVNVRSLVKSFDKIKAVDGVSFDVEKGTCFGLLGPNGAGKSTVISMIVGTLVPDSGEVKINGESIKGETDSLRQKIGYVPQEIGLFDDLNSHQNLSFFASLYSMSKVDIERRSAEVLEIAALTDRADEPIKDFSGGMKRRLNIAVALVHNPDLLVLDEPTVGVDPQSRNAIFDVLEKLKSSGMTLIYTSHYMEEVERMCDRIAIIDNGKVMLEGTLEQLLGTLESRFKLTFAFSDEKTSYAAEKLFGEANNGRVFRIDNSVEILPMNNAQAIADLVNKLQVNNLTFEDLKVERGSLEEVFLQSTGRSLRD